VKVGLVVARRARAWIETFVLLSYAADCRVARRARAWIETPCREHSEDIALSPAVRGRGLKPLTIVEEPSQPVSPAVRGRGLKPVVPAPIIVPQRRPPCAGVD